MAYRPRISRLRLIVRAREQTLRLEVWDDSALVEPSAGTITIYDADEAVVVTAAVTMTGRVATYTLAAATVPAALDYSEAWRVVWDLTIADVAERYEEPAALVRAAWRETITPGDLIGRHQELALGREVDPQQEGGSTTLGTWIDEAGTGLFTRLWTDGVKPWLILDLWAARPFLIAQALAYGLRWASTFMEERASLVILAERYEATAEKAYGTLQFRYDAGQTGVLADAKRVSAPDMAALDAGRR